MVELDDDLKPLSGRGGPIGQSETTNERLSLTIQALRNLEKTTNNSTQQNINAIDNLRNTIKSLDRKNGKLQWAIISLTVVTIMLAVLQAWAAFHPTK